MKTFSYLSCCIKRAWRGSLAVIVLCALMAVCIVVALNIAEKKNAEDALALEMEIGIVGDMENSILELGVFALQNLDSSGVYIDFTPMEAENAERLLYDKQINGYVVIPDTFVDSVLSGKHDPLTYVTLANPTALTPKLVNQMMNIVALYITESQCGVYGTEKYAPEVGEYVDYSSWDIIGVDYVTTILDRDSVFDINTVDLGETLSIEAYYITSVVVVLVLLIGITAAPVFAAKNMSLPRLLASRRLDALRQVACEYISFALLCYVSIMMIACALLLYSAFGGSALGTLAELDIVDGIMLILRLAPVCMLISAMQLIIYELTDSMLNAVILQFTVALSLAYISGCFYPVNFFPEVLQKLAAILPVGLSMNWIGGIFAPAPNVLGGMLISAAVMLLTCAAVRNYHIKGGGRA